MTLYTHIEMDGIFGNKPVTMPNGDQHPASWFRTASQQQISGAGFRIYTPPEPEPPPEPTPADFTLTRRQVRAALALAGFPLDAVPNAIATIEDDTQRALALIDWEDAPYYVRTHPLFNDAAMLSTLGLNAAAIDAMWMQAKDLPA